MVEEYKVKIINYFIQPLFCLQNILPTKHIIAFLERGEGAFHYIKELFD